MSVNKPNRKKRQPLVLSRQKPARRNRKKGKNSRRATSSKSGLYGPAALIAAVVLISCGFVGGYFALTGCDILGVENISVTGACLLEENEIVRQAGIEPGENILAVNLAVARKRLLSHPWIAAAGVSRQLPATIMVEIEEYSPVAVVDLGRSVSGLGQRFFVDKNRRIFKPQEPSDPAALPVIDGLDLRDLDDKGRPGSRLFVAALDVIETGRRLSHLIPGLSIRRVSVDRDLGITLRAFDRVGPVRFGFDEDRDHYFKKFKRLHDVLSRLDDRAKDVDIAAVGLECPGRVVVKTVDQETEVAFSGQQHKGG